MRSDHEELQQNHTLINDQIRQLKADMEKIAPNEYSRLKPKPDYASDHQWCLLLSGCARRTLRVSGREVMPALPKAPDGLICIGNSASPSPNNNFLVLEKSGGEMQFLGTESLNKRFTDFLPYVNWTAVFADPRPFDTCKLLPNQLRGTLKGTVPMCSKANPNGIVWLVHSSSHDLVVDDEGAVTCLATNSETLWY